MYWNKKYEYLGAPAEVLERQPDGDFFVYLLSRASAHASVQIEISLALTPLLLRAIHVHSGVCLM